MWYDTASSLSQVTIDNIQGNYLTMSHFAPWEEVMLVVRYEAQRSSAKPHSAEFILSLPLVLSLSK